jgi:hypothetical protein
VINFSRVDEITRELTEAKAGWPTVARRTPEIARLSYGRPLGPGMHRPWVLLNDYIEGYDAPPRLIKLEDGTWFLKGEPLLRRDR